MLRFLESPYALRLDKERMSSQVQYYSARKEVRLCTKPKTFITMLKKPATCASSGPGESNSHASFLFKI
jgi:hypothetical protein